MDDSATLVVYGRYWYDFLTIAWLVAFFLIEMLLLFRNTLIGWAMTAKCLVLSGVFYWACVNPPPLQPENITIVTAAIRAVLISVLGVVIAILIVMRIRNLTVVVGSAGQNLPIERTLRVDPYASTDDY